MAALPFIAMDDAGKFHVTEDAAKELSKLEGPLVVVAVAGMYRTGKSFLLNQLRGPSLQGSQAFKVGPTVEACTKGIWLWGQGVPITLANGTKATMVLMDTEGIGGTKASTDYDARIFSLATLICSLLVYNSLGSIDENAIGMLSFVAQLTKHVRVNGRDKSEGVGAREEEEYEEEEEEGEDLGLFFPSFIWCVRDFTLQLCGTDGRPITARTYMENSLEVTSGFDQKQLERNRIRAMLTSFFRDRDCVTLARRLLYSCSCTPTIHDFTRLLRVGEDRIHECHEAACPCEKRAKQLAARGLLGLSLSNPSSCEICYYRKAEN